MASISELLKTAVGETKYRDKCEAAAHEADSELTLSETKRQYAMQDLINAIDVGQYPRFPIIVRHGDYCYEIYQDANNLTHIRHINIVNI